MVTGIMRSTSAEIAGRLFQSAKKTDDHIYREAKMVLLKGKVT